MACQTELSAKIQVLRRDPFRVLVLFFASGFGIGRPLFFDFILQPPAGQGVIRQSGAAAKDRQLEDAADDATAPEDFWGFSHDGFIVSLSNGNMSKSIRVCRFSDEEV